MADKATLTLGDAGYELPVRAGTVGPDVIDIRKLYAQDRGVHLRSGLHLDGRVRNRT